MVALANALPLILLALQPVAEVILLCALGAWLANPRVNVLTQSARDNLNKVSISTSISTYSAVTLLLTAPGLSQLPVVSS